MRWERKNKKDRLAHEGRCVTVQRKEDRFVITLGEPGPRGLSYKKLGERASRDAARRAGERAIIGRRIAGDEG